MRPGTAKTCRPWSSACRAVMSAPLCRPASMTSTPKLRPLTMRLRMGKVLLSGEVPSGSSLMRQPPDSTIFAASASFSGGYILSSPQPSTAQVVPFAASAPRCAAVSMPRASPEITGTPA